MFCTVSFRHILELNPEALTGEANSGSQKENFAISLFFIPYNCDRHKISLCINVCYASRCGKARGVTVVG